jgi:hypothetical protein
MVVDAVVMTISVTADGGWGVLGLDVGDSEDGAFWTARAWPARSRACRWSPTPLSPFEASRSPADPIA